jgi:hypothetical protein
MDEVSIIQQLLGNKWVSIITAIVTVAAAITAVTPSKVDNSWLQKIVDLLNLAGLNLGKAKNADDK